MAIFLFIKPWHPDEIFHSLLRRQCPSWSSGEQISEIAKVLSARKFNSDFISNFLNPSKKHHSGQNVSHLAGKTAEFLVKVFENIYRNSGECNMQEKNKKGEKICVSPFSSYGFYRSIPFQRLNPLSMNEHSPWASRVQYHHRSSTNAITTTAR